MKEACSHHIERLLSHDLSQDVAAILEASLGPSGAGKSTLLTLIGLILPPNEGRIVIGGATVFDDHRTQVNVRRYRRQHLGFVF
jgi:putative ABC transport system ATP-binding protein